MTHDFNKIGEIKITKEATKFNLISKKEFQITLVASKKFEDFIKYLWTYELYDNLVNMLIANLFSAHKLPGYLKSLQFLVNV